MLRAKEIPEHNCEKQKSNIAFMLCMKPNKNKFVLGMGLKISGRVSTHIFYYFFLEKL